MMPTRGRATEELRDEERADVGGNGGWNGIGRVDFGSGTAARANAGTNGERGSGCGREGGESCAECDG